MHIFASLRFSNFRIEVKRSKAKLMSMFLLLFVLNFSLRIDLVISLQSETRGENFFPSKETKLFTFSSQFSFRIKLNPNFRFTKEKTAKFRFNSTCFTLFCFPILIRVKKKHFYWFSKKFLLHFCIKAIEILFATFTAEAKHLLNTYQVPTSTQLTLLFSRAHTTTST